MPTDRPPDNREPKAVDDKAAGQGVETADEPLGAWLRRLLDQASAAEQAQPPAKPQAGAAPQPTAPPRPAPIG